MKKSFKKNQVVEWQETDFSHLHRVPKLRYQRKEYIHQTAIKYIEKSTDQPIWTFCGSCLQPTKLLSPCSNVLEIQLDS